MVNRDGARDSEYRPVGGPLYHYTSLDALLGILKHKTLWATSVHYLNDASETELGLQLMRELVSRELINAEGIHKEFLAFLTPWLEVDLLRSPSVYVLCFSETRNDLSQWRGYTPHGRGVCLGINVHLLVNRMQKHGWQFQNVRYRQDSQLAFANAILTRMRREASAEHSSDTRDKHFASVIQGALPDLLQVAAMIKHPSFHSEQETRFMSPPIAPGDPRICFRSGRSTLIPYVQFELVDNQNDPLQLSEILIGPSPSDRLTQAAVLNLVQQHGTAIDPSRITLSNIPYREL